MSVGKAVWINGSYCHSRKEAAEKLSELLGKKIYSYYISKKLKSKAGRFVMGGVEIADRPPRVVWINGVEDTVQDAAERLGELFGRKVSVGWITSLLECCRRCVVKGVEIASGPAASGEGREPGGGVAADNPPAAEAPDRPPEEPRPEKRRPLLNRRALDFGLSKPSWFA
jgi:hypothetical protein